MSEHKLKNALIKAGSKLKHELEDDLHLELKGKAREIISLLESLFFSQGDQSF